VATPIIDVSLKNGEGMGIWLSVDPYGARHHLDGRGSAVGTSIVQREGTGFRPGWLPAETAAIWVELVLIQRGMRGHAADDDREAGAVQRHGIRPGACVSCSTGAPASAKPLPCTMEYAARRNAGIGQAGGITLELFRICETRDHWRLLRGGEPKCYRAAAVRRDQHFRNLPPVGGRHERIAGYKQVCGNGLELRPVKV